MRCLVPFTSAERAKAEIEIRLLAIRLQGRKLEEGDWSALYCRIKKTPEPRWSNLPFRDYVHNGVGIEFKVLMRKNPQGDVGRSVMHPAGTRTISFNPNGSAEAAKNEVLKQWSTQIAEFETRIRDSSARKSVDARWGVLLWARDHSQFLYFEERLAKPNPADFYAEWHEGQHRGNPTRNLHIYERATKRKRYSCTLPKNGSKLQPYFDVPTEKEGALLFKVGKTDAVPLYIPSALKARLAEDFPGIPDEQVVEQLIAAYHRSKRT